MSISCTSSPDCCCSGLLSYYSPSKDVLPEINEKKINILPFTPPRDHHKKKRRKYVHISKAPSLSEPTNSDDIIKHHGYMRVMFFWIVAWTYADIAVRSDGPPAPVNVYIGPAREQVGRSNTRGFQGAHSNAGAGLCEDRRDGILKEIVLEGMTPHKRKLLEKLGISKEDLSQLKKCKIDEDVLKVKEIIKKYWKNHTLMQNTKVEHEVNAVNVLPSALNQGCDCALENIIRPEISKLIKSCMQGTMTVEKACKAYVIAIRQHFDNSIAKISIIIEKIRQFQEFANNIIKIEDENLDKFPDEPAIHSYQESITKLRETWSEIENGLKGWRALPRMETNKLYFCEESYGQDVQKRIEAAGRRRRTISIDSLHEESNELVVALEDLKRYCYFEKEGTVEPEYEYLNKIYDSESDTRRAMSEQEEHETKSKLLSTPSPTKPIRRRPVKRSLSLRGIESGSKQKTAKEVS